MGSACRLRASAAMWFDQFEVRSALKTMVTVGRTSSTSAISMRPISSGKKRSRATTCSAVSAGLPVLLSVSRTSSKRTAPRGNSETEASPRSTGSSPVTARISACTAARTLSAGMNSDSEMRIPAPTASTAATAITRRLMPTGAVTKVFLKQFGTRPKRTIARGNEAATWNRSVTLSWPHHRAKRPVFPAFPAGRRVPETARASAIGDLERGLGLGLDLVERDARRAARPASCRCRPSCRW